MEFGKVLKNQKKEEIETMKRLKEGRKKKERRKKKEGRKK